MGRAKVIVASSEALPAHGSILGRGHGGRDDQYDPAAPSDLAPQAAKAGLAPKHPVPPAEPGRGRRSSAALSATAAPAFGGGHADAGDHTCAAPATFGGGQCSTDDPTSDAAAQFGDDLEGVDDQQDAVVAGGGAGGGQKRAGALGGGAPAARLSLYVETFESTQALRMETLNRVRCWLRDTLPREQWPATDFSDAIILDREACPWVPNDLREFAERLETFERDAAKYLRRETRLHPLWPFFEQVRGVGEVSAARLMHRVKDPRRFANPAKLWSYAGMDGPDWKARPHSWPLTKVLWNIAESFQKQKPGAGCIYRDIYDARKAVEATKPSCETCRAAGFEDHCRPAHVNNRARRYAVKMFLLDLWKAAQDATAGEEAAN